MTLKPLTPNGGYKAFRKIEIEGKGANALCRASGRVNSGLLEHLSSSCQHWGQLRLLPDPCLLIELASEALKEEMGSLRGRGETGTIKQAWSFLALINFLI